MLKLFCLFCLFRPILGSFRFLYLEESLRLSDHVGQALGGSQVLAQVPLVWAAQAVLPVTRPAAIKWTSVKGRKQAEVKEVLHYETCI